MYKEGFNLDNKEETIHKLNENFTEISNKLDKYREQTPTSNADKSGKIGDITFDNSYLYVKTRTGWKRVGLSSF